MKQNQECDRRSSAHHEAGHLAIAHIYGESDYAEIVDEIEDCGRTKYKNDLVNIEKEACLLMLLAGPVAELKYRIENSKHISVEQIESNDIHRAKQILGWNPYFDSDEEYMEKLIPYREKTETLVTENWKLICAIAAHMFQTGKVMSTEIDNLV